MSSPEGRCHAAADEGPAVTDQRIDPHLAYGHLLPAGAGTDFVTFLGEIEADLADRDTSTCSSGLACEATACLNRGIKSNVSSAIASSLMPPVFLTTNPTSFNWQRWPETEAFLTDLVARAVASHSFAAKLSERMAIETSTRFFDWVDHLVLSDRPGLQADLLKLGYSRQSEVYGVNAPAFHHLGGMFPRVAVVLGQGPEVREVAIKVESVADFSMAHDLGLDVQGYPVGPYRVGRVAGEPSLAVIERRGYTGFDPFGSSMVRAGRMRPQAARDLLAAEDIWRSRKRRHEDDALGFEVAEQALTRVLELTASPDLAAHVVLEVERDYWQSRNSAARVQKARQDRLGLGWANHDHHTFRSSRRYFPRLMRLFDRLGFVRRERFQTGTSAGWGAQILEQPTAGLVIFADLDLTADESNIDFSTQPLPELAQPSTVGLWVGLHGESILGAGMHHLECQFDFDRLASDLQNEANITSMKPFSDFAFLRQAFTQGEQWHVERARADRLLAQGWIDGEAHARFLSEGAIGSHLENLQRSEGYKGFNQQSVTAILDAVDPRKH